MATINTGVKRSLTISVTKEVNGVPVTGYPKTYNGKLFFIQDAVSYPFLSDDAFQLLSEADYLLRLAAFKLWVVSQEPGLDFTTDTVGAGASYTDLADCPTPVESTTTTLPGTTTTTTTPAPVVPMASVTMIVTYEGDVGAQNGMHGSIDMCGHVTETDNQYDNMVYINHQLPYDVPCLVDFTLLGMRILNIETPSFKYYRTNPLTPWVEFTIDNTFDLTIPTGTPGDVTVYVLISQTDINAPITTLPPTTIAPTNDVIVTNNSTVKVLSFVVVSGGNLPGATFPVAINGGTTSGTIPTSGTYDMDVEVDLSAAGYKVTLTDSNGAIQCWNIDGATTGHTFSGVVVNTTTPVTIVLADGAC